MGTPTSSTLLSPNPRTSEPPAEVKFKRRHNDGWWDPAPLRWARRTWANAHPHEGLPQNHMSFLLTLYRPSWWGFLLCGTWVRGQVLYTPPCLQSPPPSVTLILARGCLPNHCLRALNWIPG